MKLFALLFLFVSQYPTVKMGDYKSIKPFRYPYDKEQSLTLNADGSFLRIYYASEMHFEKRRHRVTGVWKQNADTLILTDTTFFDAFAKPSIKRIYGIDDTVVIKTTKYIVQKKDKLHYVGSVAGQKEWLKTPDFIYKPEQ